MQKIYLLAFYGLGFLAIYMMATTVYFSLLNL